MTRMLHGVVAAALLLCGCGGGGADKPPVRIGLSASVSGFDRTFGQTVTEVVGVAVAEINDAGGANGHELLLVEEDDESGDRIEVAIDALIGADVVGIIGPFLSGLVATAVPTIAEAEVVLISPSSTAPELVTTPPDGGYMFRTAPDDTKQVKAMAHYFLDPELSDPPITSVAIVHESGSYGEGLRNAFEDEWVSARGQVIDGTPIAYDAGMDQTAADAVWTAIAAQSPAPTTLLMIGQGSDANILIRTWLASAELPALRWFFADGAKISSFLGEAATTLPAGAVGLRGTAPTSPREGQAFQTFVARYAAATGVEDIGNEAYMANTWDAVYLLAAAIAQQSAAAPDDPIGGAGLRDALTQVSLQGQILHAGQWRDLLARIDSEGDVDYDGASGPCDFDSYGETVTPYEVWEIRLDAGVWSFVQIHYLEPRDL